MINVTQWSARQKFFCSPNVITPFELPTVNVLLTSANIPSTFFSGAKSDGSDIRFSQDISGVNELPFEIVFFNKSLNQAEIWVNVSAYRSVGVDLFFYGWCGNASATAYPASGTYGSNKAWENVRALAVHHFHQTSAIGTTLSGTLINSRGLSAYNLNVSGSVYTSAVNVSGVDDGRRVARFYKALNSRLVMNANVIPASTNRVIECRIWLNSYGGGSQGVIVSEEDASDNGHSFTVDDAGWNQTLRFKANGSSGPRHTDEYSLPPNQWKHVVGRYTSASPTFILMEIDGATNDFASQTVQNGGSNTTVGARAAGDTSQNFDGLIDELRIYDIDYNNYGTNLSELWFFIQNNPSSAVTWVGSPDYPGGSDKPLSGSSLSGSVGTLSTGGIVIELPSIAMRMYAGDVEWIDPSRFSEVVPVKRFRPNKKLNLVKFLPSIHRESETEQFTQFMEDWFNTLFDGQEGLITTSADISVSGNYRLSGVSGNVIYYQYNNPNPNSLISPSATSVNTDSKDVQSVHIDLPTDTSEKISIIEKIFRLTELKDPDLIDIENIQYFADNAGYNVDVYRNEFGNIDHEYPYRPIATSATSAAYNEQYLRFNVSNMPEWYKIKTTDNAVQVLLFSFGLIGNVIHYYTNDYLSFSSSGTGGNWLADLNGDMREIPRDYFITPHFAMGISIDESDDLIVDTEKATALIRAMKSIQPINTVFKRLAGYLTREYNIYVSMRVRKTRYIKVV